MCKTAFEKGANFENFTIFIRKITYYFSFFFKISTKFCNGYVNKGDIICCMLYLQILNTHPVNLQWYELCGKIKLFSVLMFFYEICKNLCNWDSLIWYNICTLYRDTYRC